MSLKGVYQSESDIPAEQKAFYKPDGSTWVLDVEGGMIPEATMQEYRNRNIELLKERDNTLMPQLRSYQQLGTVDEFKHLTEISAQLDEGKLVRSGKLEEAVDKRLDGVKKEHQKQLESITNERNRMQEKLSSLLIDNATMAAATKLGAKSTAIPDIIARMRNLFKVEDGKEVCYKPNGERDYGKSGDGATISEKVEELMPNAPHLFEENKGLQTEPTKHAAGPRPGTGAFGNVNPWKKESHNLTLRMRIAKENPELAKKLRAEAGVVEVGAA
jgi:hypothetical protein